MARHKSTKKSTNQKKPPLTHFLCLPLVTPVSKPQLESSIRQFRDAVATKDQSTTRQADMDDDEDQQSETIIRSVHPKAIRPIGALHCTLGVMSLSKEELEKAVETLKGLDVRFMLEQAGGNGTRQSKVSEANKSATYIAEAPTNNDLPFLQRPISPPSVERGMTPLQVDLRGLISMHPPHKTSILYSAPADLTDRLYPFCLSVQTIFKDQGFLVPDDRKLKLHATIVNTIYAKGRKRRPPRKEAARATPERAGTANRSEGDQAESAAQAQQDDRSQGHGPNANAPLKIDATSILEKFKDFVWAKDVPINRIAICEMGAKKITNAEGDVVGEQYTEVASVALPTVFR